MRKYKLISEVWMDCLYRFLGVSLSVGVSVCLCACMVVCVCLVFWVSVGLCVVKFRSTGII